jgi:hypothetical protein
MFNWKFGSKPSESDDKNASKEEADNFSSRALGGNLGVDQGNTPPRGLRGSQS